MKSFLIVISVAVLLTLGGAFVSASIANESDITKTSVKVYTNQELLDKVNAMRIERGIAPLILDERLNASAQEKANDMAKHQYYEHKSPVTNQEGYEFVFDNMSTCKYASENLNEVSPGDDPTAGWRESAAHYDAEVGVQYDATGFGFVQFNSKYYYVQHFCDIQ